jgi:hypothetical protein
MMFRQALGRARSKQAAAVLGAVAAALMVASPVAVNGFGGDTQSTRGPDVVNAAYTQPVAPNMRAGVTETWHAPAVTTPPTAPVTTKASPRVKAPHR